MPLSCDCYGGCWGTHAVERNWPFVRVTEAELEPYHAEHRPIMSYLWDVAKKHTLIPYGSYVVVSDDEIRVETEEYKALLLDAMATLEFK